MKKNIILEYYFNDSVFTLKTDGGLISLCVSRISQRRNITNRKTIITEKPLYKRKEVFQVRLFITNL